MTLALRDHLQRVQALSIPLARLTANRSVLSIQTRSIKNVGIPAASIQELCNNVQTTLAICISFPETLALKDQVPSVPAPSILLASILAAKRSALSIQTRRIQTRSIQTRSIQTRSIQTRRIRAASTLAVSTQALFRNARTILVSYTHAPKAPTLKNQDPIALVLTSQEPSEAQKVATH